MKPGEQTFKSRVVGKLLQGAFEGISRVARLHPNSKPSKHGVRVEYNVAYRPTRDPDHHLDIYVPTEAKGPLPVVLYIHGGAFQILSKDTHFAMALAFARKGMLVFNVNYHLSPRHKFPVALDDIAHAYEWVVANAGKYGGDVSRLYVAGESAGANLATALAIMATTERPEEFSKRVFATNVVPRAVMPACGILQVSNPERYQQKLTQKSWLYERILSTRRSYLDNAPRAGAGGHELADPLVILESNAKFTRELPPFFTACGTKDPLLDDTRRLGKALEKRGVRCDVHVYPGEIHAFHAFMWRKAAVDFWKQTYAFLDSIKR